MRMTIGNRAWSLAVACVAVVVAANAAAADPPSYVRKPTWQDTMLASLEALDGQGLEQGFKAFESGIVRGGDKARHVSVNVAGAREMFLFVTGDPDPIWGMANWADAKLIGKDGREQYLTNLSPGAPGSPAMKWKVLKSRHDININLHSGLYEPMRIAGREFPRGIHVQADSEIMVPLDGKYERFEAWIGIDDWAKDNGHVRFGVLGRKAAARMELWDLLERDFPHATPRRQMRWEKQDRIWFEDWKPGDFADLAKRYAAASRRVPPLAEKAATGARQADSRAACKTIRETYYRSRDLDDARTRLGRFNFRALRMAVEDLMETHEAKYAKGPAFLARLTSLENAAAEALSRVNGDRATLPDFETIAALANDLETLRREALLANPLLDFDRLLVVKRKPLGDPRRNHGDGYGYGQYLGLPRQSSWAHGTIPKKDGWDNEIAVLSPVRLDGKLTTFFRPDRGSLILDVDLHYDAGKLMFSMPDKGKHWQIWEIDADGTGLRQLTPSTDQTGVHYYDSCYLPDGRIAFISTAVLQGVPCNTSVIVGMMYRMDADGGNIRQICFEQDHDYHPSVLNNGRILYLRWDYTDTPHVWNRLLMSANPDGTGQMEYRGSNSYWPNSTFFSRAIPNHPTKIVSITTGHHEGRVGELMIFDPALGRHEADGVVQQIPHRGRKVEPIIDDKPTEHVWPKFVHPWPLSDKYFLVASKPTPHSLWGIYLVDVFDNMVLLREEEEHVLLEPIPFRKRFKPPVIPDRVQPDRNDAIVYLMDVYRGPGLEGVPRGAVKRLRLFTYHFGYQTLAGITHRVGADGPWEIKRVLGTVPVEEDGSALFRIPAKTPISVQPLDAEGKALALMRSWMTAMPGETMSCIGCHDKQSGAPPPVPTMASRRLPSQIEPWYGPTRGFSFRREVQPVLDKYCVGCHNGQPREDGGTIIDLRADQGLYAVYEGGNPRGRRISAVPKEDLIRKYNGVFEPAYENLRQYVRTGGLESDLHILPPKEFHADTSELIQMLKKGHYNVELDKEAWDRLITWIDLNAPCHGTWREMTRIPQNQRERRLALRRLYGGIDDDWEEIVDTASAPIEPIIPKPPSSSDQSKIQNPKSKIADWPLDPAAARKRQAAAGPVTRTIDLGGGLTMEFVRIPAGTFIMGDPAGEADERPLSIVEIDRPFWMARHEVTNEQFARFDTSHDSRFEHRTSWIFSEAYLGWPLNGPRQPVVRVSWKQAMEFSRWLSQTIGLKATLPTEAQWEYACRAGSDAPLFYGDLDADFSRFANVADETIRNLAYTGWRPKSPDLIPRDARFNDGVLVTNEVGHYRPNAWGLYDMHGNAAEWTRTTYRPYPYRPDDGRDDASDGGEKVVRGGSWRDRPKRCRSAFRLSYPAYQRVFNVGFRVIIEDGGKVVAEHTE